MNTRRVHYYEARSRILCNASGPDWTAQNWSRDVDDLACFLWQLFPDGPKGA